MELFNPVKVETQIYAKLKRSYGLPVWVSDLDSVLYQEFIAEPASYSADGKYVPPGSDIAHMSLLLSNGNPDNTQKIDDSQYNHYGDRNIHPTWAYSSLVVKPDGSEIVYLKASNEIYQFYSRKVSQGQFSTGQLLPIDADMLKKYNVTQYEMTWRPHTEQIFFAGYDGAGSVQSFLLDMNTGKLCVLDFRNPSSGSLHRSLYAQWSPNGRYLAIVRGIGGFPASSIDLVTLDTETGNLYTLAFAPDAPGMHYVWDIAWAPDSYHLVAIGKVYDFPGCASKCREEIDRLYLVDFISGKADLIFPSFQVSGGDVGENLAWSPDGTKILVTCYQKVARLCLIPVHVGGN
ncbi:MAG: hypothetical protein HY865_16290 [Chloroflexi bacterium]|nr:hypothetical protein [Chloroflexota bacterium]